MSEFEFLSAMFRRLGEANRFTSQAKGEADRKAWEGAALMFKGAIQDYLDMRKDQPK
jgi:hypothetical protein